jgi:YVTN family beta-propeller protein
MRLLAIVLAPLLAAGLAAPAPTPVAEELGSILTDRRVIEITIPVADNPLDIAMTADGKTAYVGQFTAGKIAEISHNVIVRSAAIGNGVAGLALSKDGTRLYVGLSNENALAVVDTKDLSVLKKIPVGTYPIGVRLSPDGRWVGVACNLSSTFVAVSTGDFSTTSVAVGAQPYYLAITADSKRAWVNGYGANDVSAIDVAAPAAGPLKLSVAGHVVVGTNPVGLALSRDDKQLWVANWGDGTISVVSTSALTVTSTRRVGNQPYWVAIHPLDGSVLVSNYGSEMLDVFRDGGETRSRVKTKDAITIVFVAPGGKRIYTTLWNHAAVSIIE